MITGTALQARAFVNATANDTLRTLLADISLATSAEARVGVCPIAQKTVTIADIIALDHVCSGELKTVAALVIKIDPAETKTDPLSLFLVIRYLLCVVSSGKAVKAGLAKYTVESINALLQSPFRQMTHTSPLSETNQPPTHPQYVLLIGFYRPRGKLLPEKSCPDHCRADPFSSASRCAFCQCCCCSGCSGCCSGCWSRPQPRSRPRTRCLARTR